MPTASLVIRSVPFDHPDASAMTEAVQAYYRTLYDGPDSSPVDSTEFAPPNGRFFVGYRDGVAVAMGGWRWIEPLADMGADHPVEIKRMYVELASRGRGYARMLLTHLEATAKAAGADAAVLSTGQPQRDAIALYRAAGYDHVPRFGFFAPYETAVHLGKWLRSDRPVERGVPSERPAGGTAR